MAFFKYRVLRPIGDFATPRGFAYTMASAARRLVSGEGPFRITVRGRDASHPRSRMETLNQIRAILSKGKAGTELRVRNAKGNIIWGVKKVEFLKATPTPNLGCHPDLERIHGAVWAKFPFVHSAGRYYCRFVDGTTIVSRHGYRSPSGDWYGSAEDIGAATMAQLRAIANFIVNETKAGRLNARTVIVADDVWTPSGGWQYYGGNYHYHVHYDVEGGSPCRP